MIIQFILPVAYQSYFNFVFALEGFFILVDLCCRTIMLKCVIQTTLHPNMKILIVTTNLQNYPAVIIRFIALFYQARILVLEEGSSFPIILSSIRSHYIGTILFGIGAAYVERKVATIFIEDYEHNHRIQYGISISIGYSFVSYVISQMFTFEVMDWRLLVLFAFILTVMGLFAYIRLYQENKRKQDSLSTKPDRYTLSIRFQLDENIRVFELLRKGILALGALNVLCYAVYVASKLEIIMQLYNGALGQLLESIFNILIVLNTPVVFAIVLASNGFNVFAKQMKMCRSLAAWLQVPSNPIICGPTVDTEMHFAALDRQWNDNPNSQPRSFSI